MSDVFCPACGLACTYHPEDQGIGPYEFWGQKCVDTHMVMMSDCCEAPVEVSYIEWKTERDAVEADRRYDEWRDERDMKGGWRCE